MNDPTPLNDVFDIPLEDSPKGPEVSALLPSNGSWPPQLVFDLGMGLDSYEDIATRNSIDLSDITRFFENRLFRQEVAMMTRDLREDNAIFRAKCKTQAESYLEDMHLLMADKDTPASTKLSIFTTLTKLGDLEPDPKVTQQTSQHISISFAMEQAEKRVAEIDITPKA